MLVCLRTGIRHAEPTAELHLPCSGQSSCVKNASEGRTAKGMSTMPARGLTEADLGRKAFAGFAAASCEIASQVAKPAAGTHVTFNEDISQPRQTQMCVVEL